MITSIKINTSTFRSSIYCSSKVLEVRWQGGRFGGPSFSRGDHVSPRWPRFLPSRYSIHPRCLEQVIVPTVVRGDEDVEEGHDHHAVRRFLSRISAFVHGTGIPIQRSIRKHGEDQVYTPIELAWSRWSWFGIWRRGDRSRSKDSGVRTGKIQSKEGNALTVGLVRHCQQLNIIGSRHQSVFGL